MGFRFSLILSRTVTDEEVATLRECGLDAIEKVPELTVPGLSVPA